MSKQKKKQPPKKEKQNITTQEDFIYFKKQCKYWQKEFGLSEWDLYFTHKDHRGEMSRVNYDFNGAKATINLSTNWEHIEITKPELNSTALHELLHLLLSKITNLLTYDFNSGSIDRLEHPIISVLLNYILKNER